MNIYISKLILIFSFALLLVGINIIIFISPDRKYLGYILIIISLVLALLVVKYYPPKEPQNSNNNDSVLFSDHEIVLLDYKIEPLINLINSYSTLKSFSMALIGKWGSGKSSYLKTLNEKLKDDYEIITINVWQLENSKNITNEIKKEFDNIIFEYNKILWLIKLIKQLFIRDYFALLSKYATKSEIKISFSFEQTIQNSQDELNNLLKEILGRKKILFLIDELDRIESKDEILNVFKLIRYTASFDNVFVLTALDIQQIEKQLDDINYIHKVFNLKYLIPTIDKDELVTYFEDNFSPKLSYFNQNITYLDKKIELISSYREVKNIFNDTYTFVRHLSNTSKNWYDFISLDFIFNLNLLKAIDFEVYTFLLIDNGFKIYLIYLDLEKNSDKVTEFLEKNKQLEPFLPKLEKYKLLLMIHRKNFTQYLDIYKQHKIYNYHIDDKKYETFIKDTNELKEAYERIRYNPKSNQIKFLLNILNKNQSDKNILDTIVSLINSPDFDSSNFFNELNTYDSIHENTKNNILTCLVETICNQNTDFKSNLIKNLIVSYLNTNNIKIEYIVKLIKKLEINLDDFIDDNKEYSIIYNDPNNENVLGKELKEIIIQENKIIENHS